MPVASISGANYRWKQALHVFIEDLNKVVADAVAVAALPTKNIDKKEQIASFLRCNPFFIIIMTAMYECDVDWVKFWYCLPARAHKNTLCVLYSGSVVFSLWSAFYTNCRIDNHAITYPFVTQIWDWIHGSVSI